MAQFNLKKVLDKVKALQVGGLPVPSRAHGKAIAQLGLAMQGKITLFDRDDGQRVQLRLVLTLTLW